MVAREGAHSPKQRGCTQPARTAYGGLGLFEEDSANSVVQAIICLNNDPIISNYNIQSRRHEKGCRTWRIRVPRTSTHWMGLKTNSM